MFGEVTSTGTFAKVSSSLVRSELEFNFPIQQNRYSYSKNAHMETNMETNTAETNTYSKNARIENNAG